MVYEEEEPGDPVNLQGSMESCNRFCPKMKSAYNKKLASDIKLNQNLSEDRSLLKTQIIILFLTLLTMVYYTHL